MMRGLAASLTSAVRTLVVVLPAFWTLAQLGRWWAVPLAAIVLAVMLGLSLPPALVSVRRSDWAVMAAGLVATTAVAGLAGVGIAAGGIWRLAGAAGFTVLAGVTVWLRRFGTTWRNLGLVAALPLIATLVAPWSKTLSWAFFAWTVIAALAAAAWAYATAYLGSVRAEEPPSAVNQPTTAGGSGRTLRSSTRLAIQLALAVGLAFGAAQVIQLDHLVWPVMTALLVQNNNRGRGDVAWKGAQRLVGALAGTAVATVLVGLWPTGDARAVVAIFVAIALAAALRPFGYAYWAACVTAGLAFLYGYLGEGGIDQLGQRLIGIAVGGVIAVAVAWLVLPVRTTDVVRSRLALVGQAMRTVADARQAGTETPALIANLRAARSELAKLLPTLQAARRFGTGQVRTLADKVQPALAKADALLAASAPGAG